MFKKIKTNLISVLFSFVFGCWCVFVVVVVVCLLLLLLLLLLLFLGGGPFFYSFFRFFFFLSAFFFTFFSSLSFLLFLYFFSYSDFSVPLKPFCSISEWFMDDFPDKCAGHTAIWMSNFGMTSVCWPHCSMNEQLWEGLSIMATL